MYLPLHHNRRSLCHQEAIRIVQNPSKLGSDDTIGFRIHSELVQHPCRKSWKMSLPQLTVDRARGRPIDKVKSTRTNSSSPPQSIPSTSSAQMRILTGKTRPRVVKKKYLCIVFYTLFTVFVLVHEHLFR